MDGRTLALGTISALALVGAVGRRTGGSRALPDLHRRLVAILADYEEDDFVEDFHGKLADLIACFAEVGVTELASGSQRIVFDLGDGTVGKVDYDVDAIANRLEAKNYKEWRAVRTLLCPVPQTLAHDRLLVMPKAGPIPRGKKRELRRAMATFGPGQIHLFDGDFEPNWGWYNGGPVLLDYAQDPE